MTIKFYFHSSYVLCASHTAPFRKSQIIKILYRIFIVSFFRSRFLGVCVYGMYFFFLFFFWFFGAFKLLSTYKYFSVFLQARVRVKLPYECHLVLIAYCAHKNNKNRCYRVRCVCVYVAQLMFFIISKRTAHSCQYRLIICCCRRCRYSNIQCSIEQQQQSLSHEHIFSQCV